jgi:hypothetical protein
VSDLNNTPVSVTGYEERRHPAVRQLARACIEIARLRLAQQKVAEELADDESARPAAPEQEVKHG